MPHLDTRFSDRTSGRVFIRPEGGFRAEGALRAARLEPCSTIKVIIALAALENGLIRDDTTVRRWDGTRTGNKDWDRDLNLRQALQTSAGWYFHAFARELGEARFRATLESLRYGSGWKGHDPAAAEHDRTVTITPGEQARLARRLADDRMPFRQEHQALVRDCLTVPDLKGAMLWGKTGSSGKDAVGKSIGWYVGAVTVAGKTTAFAVVERHPEAFGPRVRERVVAQLRAGTFLPR